MVGIDLDRDGAVDDQVNIRLVFLDLSSWESSCSDRQQQDAESDRLAQEDCKLSPLRNGSIGSAARLLCCLWHSPVEGGVPSLIDQGYRGSMWALKGARKVKETLC